jgi:hypothetical protein
MEWETRGQEIPQQLMYRHTRGFFNMHVPEIWLFIINAAVFR